MDLDVINWAMTVRLGRAVPIPSKYRLITDRDDFLTALSAVPRIDPSLLELEDVYVVYFPRYHEIGIGFDPAGTNAAYYTLSDRLKLSIPTEEFVKPVKP